MTSGEQPLRYITIAGYGMVIVVNTAKTQDPAISMIILGLHYYSQSKIFKLGHQIL